MKKVSVMVPCYNEEKSLPMLYTALNKVSQDLNVYDWEFLFINDGSKDGTLSVLEDLHQRDERCCYVDLSRNFGKEAAMLAGFDYATGDCMVIMDADLQDPPLLIHEMLQKWEEGYDDVYAQRISRGKESWLRNKLSLLYYWLLQKASDINVLPNVGDFRLLDRQCIDALKQMREHGRYTKGLFCYIGYRKCCVLFDRGDRVSGQSAWNFWSLLRLAIEGLTSYTTAPLRFASVLGAVIAFFALVAGLFYLCKTIIFGDEVRGFTTLIFFLSFYSGILLLAIGIQGEYIARVFNETKRRPVYFARTYNGKKIN